MTINHTLIIWADTANVFPEFLLVKGDYRHLDGIVINESYETYDESKYALQDELDVLMFGCSSMKDKMEDMIPERFFNIPADERCIIRAGFLA